MKHFWPVFRAMWRDQPVALMRGAALAAVVLVMGVGLLGLSGWFITAAAAVGLAGAGATFDVFRPSALVRFMALGRAAARYGERVLTHEATLHALQGLRLRVLAGQMAAPYAQMIRLRGAQALNRLTADIDVLDGLPLRLALPVMAGAAAFVLALMGLWWLVSPAIALWVVGGYILGAALLLRGMSRPMIRLSRRASLSAEAFRARLIDLIRARGDLTIYGALQTEVQAVLAAEARRLRVQTRLDRAERWVGTALSLWATLIAAGALALGMSAVQAGRFEPAFAALGFFAALALAEVLAPLRRAMGDLGRMVDAARRVAPDLGRQPCAAGPITAVGGKLRLEHITLMRPGTACPVLQDLSFSLQAGETLALTGPSGAGKSTVLLAVAGLHPVAGGAIFLGDTELGTLPEQALRATLTLLPQRSALMDGTVAEALRLCSPASDADLWQVLEAVQLAPLVRGRGGLAMPLGPRGKRLSGGEARRLTLARALLRRPAVLLLDEPTEGLDAATALAVLQGIRQFLPDAAILMASHRTVEINAADRILSLDKAHLRCAF